MNSLYHPLHVFKYCPKCGRSGFSPNTEKSLQCNSCGFRYFINMSGAVAAIILNESGEILFTLRKHDPAAGKLDLPGGFVDLGETAEEAVKREIFEELHLEITALEYFGTFHNIYLFGDLEYQTLDIVFISKVASFDAMQVADDVSGYIFRKPDEVKPDEIGLGSIRSVLEKYLKNQL